MGWTDMSLLKPWLWDGGWECWIESEVPKSPQRKLEESDDGIWQINDSCEFNPKIQPTHFELWFVRKICEFYEITSVSSTPVINSN